MLSITSNFNSCNFSVRSHTTLESPDLGILNRDSRIFLLENRESVIRSNRKDPDLPPIDVMTSSTGELIL